MTTAFDLLSTFVHLGNDATAAALPVTEDFWKDAADGRILRDGWLIARFRQDGDWPNWECHPAGDEILVLLSGTMTLILDGASGQTEIEMGAGRAAVVPRGVWHTARVHRPGELIAFTPCEGTTNSPRPRVRDG